MKVGGFFSGVAGIELGFWGEGFEITWFVENDRYARRVLKKNFSRIPVYDDVRQVVFEELQRPDIVVGGFPCQDISIAGTGEGIVGKRSGLWSYFAEGIRVLRPQYAVIENVPALTHRGLHAVLTDLASFGYDAEWDCIPAISIGAPHRRDRIFIVAYPNSDRRSGEFGGTSKKRCNSDEIFAAQPESKDMANTSFHRCKQMPKRLTDRGSSKRIEEDIQERKKLPLAYSDCQGLETRIFSASQKASLERFRSGFGRRQWETEPDVGRVADGIPFRVDRNKCLGNAVVPLVAQFIAQRIKEATSLQKRQEG